VCSLPWLAVSTSDAECGRVSCLGAWALWDLSPVRDWGFNITLSVGCSSHAIGLFVPIAPPVHAAAALKASAFDYAADLLLSHLGSYSSAELIASFHHIPSNSYNAGIEATAISRRVSIAFFAIDNLIGLGFRDSAGKTVKADKITSDLAKRPPSLAYFAFRSVVDPSLVDPRIELPVTTFEFLLPLPQTTQRKPQFISSSGPSATPSESPSEGPSTSPSASPRANRSANRSASPSASPSVSPSPSASPSSSPISSPRASPSAPPSASPSASPSARLRALPSTSLSALPSSSPSASPSGSPSSPPSASPSASPSALPSASPSARPPAHCPFELYQQAVSNGAPLNRFYNDPHLAGTP
jgi:hypothetical protein